MSGSVAGATISFKAAARDAPEISPREEAMWLLRHFFGADATRIQKELLGRLAETQKEGGCRPCTTNQAKPL